MRLLRSFPVEREAMRPVAVAANRNGIAEQESVKIPILTNEVDFVIVGAGAAGLSAARALRESGRSFVVLEASHRIGGRAYTEELRPGEPFDLGAHWIHSASLNPFAEIAKNLDFTTLEEGDSTFESDGRKLNLDEAAALYAFVEGQYEAKGRVLKADQDASVYEITERGHKWTSWFDYYFAQEFTADVDQVSARDVLSYVASDDEDLALRDGFGTLLSRYCADVPVTLNSAVSHIDWSGPGVRLETPGGTLTAKAAIITVSTGVLAGGEIRFSPELPVRKREAIAALPMGNSNRICLGFEKNVFDVEPHTYIALREKDEEPVEMVVRPFGFDYVEIVTGGRFADWLESAGEAAAVDFATRKVQAVFGENIATSVDRHIVSAWRGDGLTLGTYSYAIPGGARQRVTLSEPLDNKLFFAGEACSVQFTATVHGAWFTGETTAAEVLKCHPVS